MLTASIYGRLGRNPEQRETRNGTPMVTTSIAVDVTPHHGEPITAWVDLVAFGSVAEILSRHSKADMLGAIGKMTLRKWTARDGSERESWGMAIDALHSSRTVRPGRNTARSESPPEGGAPEPASQAEFNDDIPF